MGSLLASFLLALSVPETVNAHWQTTDYALKGGWNAIYLHGDASYTSIEELFSSGDAMAIEEVWRWNANPGEAQFTESPLLPSATTAEWSIWRRDEPDQSSLIQLNGQAAYLIKCTGTETDTYAVPIKTRAVAPSSLWVRSGANLMGFPCYYNGSSYPTFGSYFATFPVAITAPARVFEYIGGELGPSNPMQVFSPQTQSLDRNKAYWFEAEVVSNFYAPLEITVDPPSGLEFGSSLSSITVRIRNRSSEMITVVLSTVASEQPPADEPSIGGPVPLTFRRFDPTTYEWIETPLTTPIGRPIGPLKSIAVTFGVNRAQMTGSLGDMYASLLRIRDNGNLSDIYLPVSATVPSLAGLWVGDAMVSEVESKVASSPGTTTPRSFPLRVLMHIDETGDARLLSQVFIGTLVDEGNPFGLCTREAGLKQDEKHNAQRIMVSHMPLDRVIGQASPGSSGNVATGAMLVRTIQIPYMDPTNPFVHQYHPDHDNKDARPDGTSDNLSEGNESYTVERTCTFEFTSVPPEGTGSLGWGTTVIGGNYTEVLSGLHKEDITVSGSFVLRRVTDEAAITIN